MPSIFLAFYNHADATRYIELHDGGDPVLGAKVYLPRSVGEDIDLARKAPNASSYVEIEVINNFVALTVFGNEPCVLLSPDSQYTIPRSMSDQHYTLLLRDQDQFSASAGRWGVVWDDDQGSLSHSMRPPAPPQFIKEMDDPTIGAALNASNHSQNPDSKTGNTLFYLGEGKNRSEMSNDDDSNEIEKTAETTVKRIKSDSSPQAKHGETPLKRGRGDQNAGDEKVLVAIAPGSEIGMGKQGFVEGSLSGKDVDQSESAGREHSDGRGATITSNTWTQPAVSPDVAAEPVRPTTTEEIEADAERAKRGQKRKKDAYHVVKPDSERSKKQKLSLEVSAELPNTISAGEQGMEDTISVAQRPNPKYRTSERHRRSASTVDSPPRKMRSHSSPRSSRRSTSTTSADTHDEEPPIVFFASSTDINEHTKVMSTFKSLGGKEVTKITEANILCVGTGPLKKTGSFLLAILSGCDIVKDEWVVSAHRTNRLPNVSAFLPKDQEREIEWNFTLKDAVVRGKAGLGQLLERKTVYITKQLSKELGKSKCKDLGRIATKLGAGGVKSSLPKHQPEGEMLILGAVNDAEGGLVRRLGEKLYNKDLLSMAVLRGKVEFDSDEFTLQLPIKDEEDSS